MVLTNGPDPNFTAQIKSLPGGVCFNAATDPNQAGLWQTDGTAEGTQSVAAFSSATGEPVRLSQFTRFMSRNLYFLVDGELFRYRSATGEVSEPVGYDGSEAPGDILALTTAGDKLVIITDSGDAGEALRLYGSDNAGAVVIEVVVVDYFSRVLTYMAEAFLGTSDTLPGGSAQDGYLRW